MSRRTYSPRVVVIAFAVIAVIAGGGWWYQATRPATRLRRGQEAARARDYIRAEHYADLLKNSGDNDGYHLLMGEVALQRGLFDKGLGHLMQVHDASPLHFDAAVLSARCLISLRRPRPASELLLHVISEKPTHADAHRYLATIFYDQGDLSRAVPHLEEVAKLDTKDARPLRLLGLVRRDREEHEEAAAAYRESLKRNPHPPDEAEVRVELAVSLIKLRKEDEVLAAVAGIETEAAQAVRAEAMIALGQETEAIELLDRGLKEHPDYGGFLRLRGERYVANAQPAKAIPLLEKLVEQVPDDFRGRYQLAQAYADVGRKADSDAQHRKHKEITTIIEQIDAKQKKAIENPWDPGVRRELADLCDKIHRPKLAEMWRRAAEAAESSR